MEIGPAASSRFPLAAAPSTEPVEVKISPPTPLQPARWAAAEKGLNQKKALGLADKQHLEDCPICLDEKADIQMHPCGHSVCGNCLDVWMSQRSSFAQTLRNGCSDTTCPLCRTAVVETTAASASQEPSPSQGSQPPTNCCPSPSSDSTSEACHAPVAPRGDGEGGRADAPPNLGAGKAPEPGNISSWGRPPASPIGASGSSMWGDGRQANIPSFFEPPEHPQDDLERSKAPREERTSATSDTIEARLAAVMQDEPEPKSSLDAVKDEETKRKKEQEEALAHAAWMKAQMAGGTASPTTSQAASDASTTMGVGPASSPPSAQHASPPPETTAPGAVGSKPPDAWASLSGGGAFGMEPWGSGPYSLGGAAAPPPVDRRVEQQLRTELGALRDELSAERARLAQEQARADKAVADSRRFEEKLATTKEELRRSASSKEGEMHKLQASCVEEGAVALTCYGLGVPPMHGLATVCGLRVAR